MSSLTSKLKCAHGSKGVKEVASGGVAESRKSHLEGGREENRCVLSIGKGMRRADLGERDQRVGS